MTVQFDNLWIRQSVDETEFSVRELEVLNRIATVVSSASDINDVYSSFAALVADVIEWDYILVTTPNGDGKTFTIRVREGGIVPGRSAGTKIDIAGSVHGEIVKHRRTQYLTASDGQTVELALKVPALRESLLAGYRSFMGAPLFSQDEIVGAIHIVSFEPSAFSEHERMLLERIALFVGPAVGRFAAYDELKQDGLRSKSLLRIGQLLLSAHDFGDVFEQLVEEMRAVVDVDRLTISVAEPDGETVVDRYMYGVPVPGYEVNRVIRVDSLEPHGLNVASHGYVFAENSMRDVDPVTSAGLLANYKAGLRSAMFAGLRSVGRLVGTINVKSLNEGAYGAPELEYFEQVADHVAASIQRTLAHESEIEMNRVQNDRILSRRKERRAVDVIRAKQRLLSSASQELRTPLSGIVAFVDLLARNRHGNMDEKQIRYLSIIRRNAEDLAERIDSLIEHAEIKPGQLHIDLKSFEMATMLREAATDAVPKLVEQGHSVNVESDEDIEFIGDRRHLITAIEHLIKCASRHASPDTSIQVLGRHVDTRVELSVVWHRPGDNGDSAAGEIDPFWDGTSVDAIDKTEPPADLTYARAVALAHGGDATYSSTVDDDAMFTIRIPVKQ